MLYQEWQKEDCGFDYMAVGFSIKYFENFQTLTQLKAYLLTSTS